MPTVLHDPKYFDIRDQNAINNIVTDIRTYRDIPTFLNNIVVGFLVDIIGRRKTLLALWIICGIFAFIIPLPAPNVYPWLIVITIT